MNCWLLCKKAQHNLSFPKTTIVSALNILVKIHEIKESWQMTDSEESDFVITVGRRIRNLCKMVAQGELKSKNASKP